jgi:hypothetical protein
MGVERCLAILRMFASVKTHTPMEDKDKKNDN